MFSIGRIGRRAWVLAVIVGLVALVGVWSAPVDAATNGFINFVPSTSSAGPACSNLLIHYQGGYMPQFDEDGVNRDWAQVVVVDATGQVLDTVGVYGPLGGPYGFSYCVGYPWCIVPPIAARPLTIALFDLPGPPTPSMNYLTHGVFMDEDYFDPGVLHPACGASSLLSPFSFLPSPPPLFHYADGRLDDSNTVAPVAVYPTETGVQVWDGAGHLLIDVSADVLADLPDFPAENTLIAQSEDGSVALYKLTTGEYQVNAGPDADGFVYVLIWTGFPPEDVYTKGFSVE